MLSGWTGQVDLKRDKSVIVSPARNEKKIVNERRNVCDVQLRWTRLRSGAKGLQTRQVVHMWDPWNKPFWFLIGSFCVLFGPGILHESLC